MSNYDLFQSAPIGGKNPPTYKTLVSTRRLVLKNWMLSRTLQPLTEPVIAHFSVPSELLVEGQVSGLGTVHPLLTLNVFST